MKKLIAKYIYGCEQLGVFGIIPALPLIMTGVAGTVLSEVFYEYCNDIADMVLDMNECGGAHGI